MNSDLRLELRKYVIKLVDLMIYIWLHQSFVRVGRQSSFLDELLTSHVDRGLDITHVIFQFTIIAK